MFYAGHPVLDPDAVCVSEPYSTLGALFVQPASEPHARVHAAVHGQAAHRGSRRSCGGRFAGCRRRRLSGAPRAVVARGGEAEGDAEAEIPEVGVVAWGDDGEAGVALHAQTLQGEKKMIF